MGTYVEITMSCQYEHVMGVYRDKIDDRLPLHCGECDGTVSGMFPFKITTKVVPGVKVLEEIVLPLENGPVTVWFGLIDDPDLEQKSSSRVN